MPVTQTAKRALRGSNRKANHNKLITYNLETAIRIAKKTGKNEDVQKVYSLSDRAVKTHTIHKNKASRIKARLMAFVAQKFPRKAASTKKTTETKKPATKKAATAKTAKKTTPKKK